MSFMMLNQLTNMLTVRFARTLLPLAFALGPVLIPLEAQTTPFIANDRLQLLPIDHSLKVAEQNEIPLRISNPNVKTVVIDWGIYRPGSRSPDAQESKSAEYDLLPGTSIVHFTPSVIGKLRLGILVFFQDGGFARKDEDVETVLPDRPPEKFIFQKDGHPWSTWNQNRTIAIVDHTVWLDMVAFYPGFDGRIHLPATDIAFHVLNYPGKEPLQLDSATGIIKPVAAGRALVQADFAGLTTFTCVIVFSSGPGGPNQDCNDLLPPGKSMPPEEPLGSFPRVKAVQPSTSR
jgi:hypothetical protein